MLHSVSERCTEMMPPFVSSPAVTTEVEAKPVEQEEAKEVPKETEVK